MNYKDWYLWGVSLLENSNIDEAKLDARLLLEYVCGTDRNTLLVHGDRVLSEEEVAGYQDAIERRGKHIPLQHITGCQDFMGLSFLVNEHTLIPRQDTEILVEEAMKHLHDGMRILDMCTGSGCILISLLYYSNDCTGVGADFSKNALEVACGNASKLLINEKENSAVFVHSDLFSEITEQFDLIVSNPPYIKTKDIETLMPEVKDYEPVTALDGREDGLYFYRIITEKAKEHLYGGGTLLFEIGYDQGEAVQELMEKAGYIDVKIIKDYAGLDRVVYGQKGIINHV